MRAFLALAALLLAAAPPGPARSGNTLSLELKDADVRDALRAVAEVSRLNFVVDEEVKGRVTLKLRNVPWEDALAVLLRAEDLGQERSGTVVRIAPLRKLAGEKEAALRAERADKAQAPLKTRVIPVSNARAEDLVPLVKPTLSERGTIAVDKRTNTLIVRDVE